MILQRNKKRFEKKSKKGFRGYPVATVALYGPDNKTATKVVASLVTSEDSDPEIQQKWFSESDVRNDMTILEEVYAFVEKHQPMSVVMTQNIIGCPHEEGIDYPGGESCPECPFWKNRDRWTGEAIH